MDHLANATDELALPYYWAGMVLVGDVEPIRTDSQWMRSAAWMLAALVLMAVGYRLLRNRRRPTAG